jgi:hypothetical protein
MTDKKIRYKYPLDETDYKATVTFKVQEEQPTGSTQLGDAVSDIVKDKRNAIIALEAEYKRIAAFSKDERDTERLDEIKDEREQLLKELNSFKGLDRSTEVAPSKRKIVRQVQLYLPMGLAFRDNVTYENFDLGQTGAMVEGGMGIAQSMAKGIGSFVSGLTGSANANMAKLAGVQLASKFGSFSDEVTGALKLQGGVTVNPNTRVLFKQSNIRDFSFTFKFVAKSKEEAKEIQDIIRVFREELYPDDIRINTGANSSISVGYVFPKKFNIEFAYDGKEIPGLAKIKPCYLRDVTTNFNTSAMAMHKDGNFLECDMTLSFQEERALVRKDVEEGY